MMSDAPPIESSKPLRRLFVFLLAPSEKVFECIRLDVSSDLGLNPSIGDIFDFAPMKATEPMLCNQKLIGLCRMEDVSEKHGGPGGSGTDDVLTIRDHRASEYINNGELLIAIPEGFTADHCKSLVSRIFKKQPKIRKLLQRTDPLAPRNASSSARRKASNTGGMKRSSSMSSMRGLTLEAIEEGENESKTSNATSTRDGANASINHESIGQSTCNSFDDTCNITKRASCKTDLHVNPRSNNIDPGIEDDITRKREAEDIVRGGEIQCFFRRDSDKKLMEKKIQERIEARNDTQAEIESRVNINASDDAKEQLLESDNEDQHAIERLALEASELESSFKSETLVLSNDSPDSPPKARTRKLHRTAAEDMDENATPVAAFLPRAQHPPDNSSAVPAEEETKVPHFRTKFKAMKRRIKRATNSMKHKLQLKASTATATSAIVALSSALYHMWNPNPIGLSAYVVFIIVFVTSAALLRKRKLSIVQRRRRRSRSLSTTPIRKGSIRRIQIAKRASTCSDTTQ